MRKILIVFLILSIALIVSACDPKNMDEAFEQWKVSSEAYDYNGDRKITIEDYHFYLEFKEWLGSNESYDYNTDRKIDIKDFTIHKEYMDWLDSDESDDFDGDRKISFEDYVLFLEYKEWKLSSGAEDINKDGKIDKVDFEIVEVFQLLVGKYQVRNYNFDSSLSDYWISEDLDFESIGEILDGLDIYVQEDHTIVADFSTEKMSALGANYATVETARENAFFEVLSKYLVVLRTEVMLEGTKVLVPFYLEKIEKGFHCDFEFEYNMEEDEEVNSYKGIISFDIIKTS